MNSDDRERFAQIWTAVRDDIYGKQVSISAMEIVFKSLERFELSDIERAIQIHVNDTENGKFPIMPAHIVANIEGAGQERASAAWNKLIKAVKDVGAWEDVVFDDPIIHAIVHNEGGWLVVCEMTDEDIKYLQTRFIKQYVAYVSRREFTYPKLLKGIANADNAGKTYDDGTPYELNKPAVVGDKETARLVYDQGSDSRLKIEHSHEVSEAVKKLVVSEA